MTLIESQAHNTKLEYIQKLTSQSSHYKQKRAVTIQNAKLHAKSLEVNGALFKDLELGDRIKVKELRQLVHDDPTYQNLTTEEEERMKQDVLELREQRKTGARPTNKSAAQDYLVAFFSRSNLEDTFEPNWICSPNAANFSQEAMSYGMWDIARLLEQWACAKAKGSRTVDTLSTMQKECSAIINGTLKTVSQSRQALMNYANYDTKVVERYQTKLMGWTYREFKSPFDIHTIDDVRTLLEALQCDDVSKRIAAGEKVGKARQPRSDKGVKRPRKKAPGTGEGEDDGAPPAKKQKRGKAVPETRATTTKKAPKKSKKSQLPPTRPTSNEFVESDADVDSA
ncbi:uncharacterized protein LACBIDRAFT_320606 [Laccaria bicolor S238N-H82]|uniref:Predicted protein n=1 Tax=Laccaria bicolor (strain S238N-H82 / ATCC MYA-4686) TaxID=486041 RepID=B0CQK6_LACBS|nr:uncharacterized protein LACBIDRAFT_320606 [Laccaria bicolor S238N-H82]EDR15662.1 predicted protein [Laccaria bicolor S238N-H82]|eukprot:XP_001873870.1 predicted protein [Laccaria bicolor S238N-H82]